jgi:hypothetical protein
MVAKVAKVADRRFFFPLLTTLETVSQAAAYSYVPWGSMPGRKAGRGKQALKAKTPPKRGF